MYRLTGAILGMALLFVLLGGGQRQAQAWSWGEKSLVTINSRQYSADDFRHWWNSWREKDTAFPETPDDFIEWHLLAREAESMEFYSLPEYKRKVQTFLKVRSLMMLKYEEVDSKINIDESALRAKYDRECCPRLRVEIIGFDKKEDAVSVSQGLNAASLKLEDLLDRPEAEDGRHYYGTKWLRFGKIPEEWQRALNGLKVGAATSSLVNNHGNGFVVLYLYESKGPDEADFESLKKGYYQDLRKQAQWRLTNELVGRLRKKYNVQVDQEVYDRLDLSNVSDELLDKPLINMDFGTITAREFVRPFRREQELLKRDLASPEKIDERKKITLANVLAQTLTTWDALQRHYEEKEPFSWVYQFYTENRLIAELEKRLFRNGPSPTEEEIARYYAEHQQEFRVAGHITLKRIVADKKLIDKIWLDINLGEGFDEVASRYYKHPVTVQTIPYARLGPELQKVVQPLVKGEVSRPFKTKGHVSIIKLLDRQASAFIPLEKARRRIAGHLRQEKFERQRAAYLAELRTKSNIFFNQGEWESIKSELGSEK